MTKSRIGRESNGGTSYFQRPDAELRIPNLVLAADYVRTFTDLASMEAANEAGRRAVRALLRREGKDPTECPIWPLVESSTLEKAQRLDKLLYVHGRPHVMEARGRSTATGTEALG